MSIMGRRGSRMREEGDGRAQVGTIWHTYRGLSFLISSPYCLGHLVISSPQQRELLSVAVQYRCRSSVAGVSS